MNQADHPDRAQSRVEKIAAFAFLFALSALVAWVGALVTRPNIPLWYEGLNHPFFRPPNAVFAPMWTLLYALMTLAAYRVWLIGRGAERRLALATYVTQLAVNCLWSFAFFGGHSPALGLVVIGGLLPLIALTIRRFYPIDAFAGLLLVPYLGWALFAGVLNAAILYLNP